MHFSLSLNIQSFYIIQMVYELQFDETDVSQISHLCLIISHAFLYRNELNTSIQFAHHILKGKETLIL